MALNSELVGFGPPGEKLAGMLFLPENQPAAAVIVCHGAGEFKENYFELCEYLARRGIVALAMDMHGHGASTGDRFYVQMHHWVADVRAAINFLSLRPELDTHRIAAFGLSSGGTAVLETALIDPRLRALVALDATVRNSMPALMGWAVRTMTVMGKIKQGLTGSPWRVPLAKLSVGPKIASDPEINRRILRNPRSLEAFMAFPLPGAEEAFFVDTLARVAGIRAPTLILWGGDDTMDPPETGKLLFAALTCKKRLEIIPGNGHVGHMDRNRHRVFELTAQWILENLPAECFRAADSETCTTAMPT